MRDRLLGKCFDGRPRCQARISWGSVWDAGRRQCQNAAKDGEALCGTHLRQAERRAAKRAARASDTREE